MFIQFYKKQKSVTPNLNTTEKLKKKKSGKSK